MIMASLDELMAQLQQVNERVAEAVNAANAAGQGAERIQGQFMALGAQAQVAAVAQIRQGIEQIQKQLHGNIDLGSQLITLTKAAKG
jgi:hypothetical protein